MNCPVCDFKFEGRGYVTDDRDKLSRIFDGSPEELQEALAKCDQEAPEESFLICWKCTSVLQLRGGSWVVMRPHDVDEEVRAYLGEILLKVIVRKFMRRFLENPEDGLAKNFTDMMAEIQKIRAGHVEPGDMVDALQKDLEARLKEQEK